MVSSKMKKILCEINNYNFNDIEPLKLSTDDSDAVRYEDLLKYWFDTLNLSEKDLTMDPVSDDITLFDSYHEEKDKLWKTENDVINFVSNNMIFDELFWNKIDRFFKEKLGNLKWSYQALQSNYGIHEEDYDVYGKFGMEIWDWD